MKTLFLGIAVCLAANVYVVGAGLQAGPSAKRTTADGVYTVDQARRGRDQYRKRCVLCHLDMGQGREAEPFIAGQSLEREGDAEAPPVAGDAFLTKWNGHTVRELNEKMASTMPVGGAGTLSPQEYVDVLAYLLELSKLPAGQQELPVVRDQLEAITIGK
jgi:cytochrome c